MADLLVCELLKLRRRKLFFLAALTALFFPLAFNVLMGKPNDTFEDQITVCYQFTGYLIQIPLIVVLAAQLFSQEQDSGTLKNLLCVPVARAALAKGKLLLLLLFSMVYSLSGYLATMCFALLRGLPLGGIALHLLLSTACSFLFFAAAMPCVLLVVFLNKSTLICVIIAFFYTTLNYILAMSKPVIFQPTGLNMGTLLPLPLLQRWLTQFFSAAGEQSRAYHAAFSPYFSSTPACFAVMSAEAALCLGTIIMVYNRREA